ncbi:MAG: thiol-disulfide oxidoreductase DCC family protein [Bacillota bacterium]
MNINSIVVYYDGWCPLCRKFKRRIEKLDMLKSIIFVSIRDVEYIRELDIPLEKLETEMHVKMPNGKILSGYDSITAVFGRIPLLCWLWVPMKFFKWIGAGDKLYRTIASQRIIIPTGNCIVQCKVDFRK